MSFAVPMMSRLDLLSIEAMVVFGGMVGVSRDRRETGLIFVGDRENVCGNCA